MKNLLCLGIGYLIGLSINKPSKPKVSINISNESNSIYSLMNSKEVEKVILKSLKNHSFR